MRTASIRRLHEETGRLVDAAQRGEVIVIQRRGVPVAELRGLQPRRKRVQVPDFARRYARFPKISDRGDSGRLLEEDRR
jgi:antitoxin (DNA-binding transcriptional repressor) of toxin-antitoxin stability system